MSTSIEIVLLFPALLPAFHMRVKQFLVALADGPSLLLACSHVRQRHQGQSQWHLQGTRACLLGVDERRARMRGGNVGSRSGHGAACFRYLCFLAALPLSTMRLPACCKQGCGVVEFDSQDQAEKAIELFNGTQVRI